MRLSIGAFLRGKLAAELFSITDSAGKKSDVSMGDVRRIAFRHARPQAGALQRLVDIAREAIRVQHVHGEGVGQPVRSAGHGAARVQRAVTAGLDAGRAANAFLPLRVMMLTTPPIALEP